MGQQRCGAQLDRAGRHFGPSLAFVRGWSLRRRHTFAQPRPRCLECSSVDGIGARRAFARRIVRSFLLRSLGGWGVHDPDGSAFELAEAVDAAEALAHRAQWAALGDHGVKIEVGADLDTLWGNDDYGWLIPLLVAVTFAGEEAGTPLADQRVALDWTAPTGAQDDLRCARVGSTRSSVRLHQGLEHRASGAGAVDDDGDRAGAVADQSQSVVDELLAEEFLFAVGGLLADHG